MLTTPQWHALLIQAKKDGFADGYLATIFLDIDRCLCGPIQLHRGHLSSPLSKEMGMISIACKVPTLAYHSSIC